MQVLGLSLVCLAMILAACASHPDAVAANAKTHGARHALTPPGLNCKTTSVAGQLYTFCQ
jgi:starvation-inducible outer membrane lipoprotein